MNNGKATKGLDDGGVGEHGFCRRVCGATADDAPRATRIRSSMVSRVAGLGFEPKSLLSTFVPQSPFEPAPLFLSLVA
jgi:hypothetical protein